MAYQSESEFWLCYRPFDGEEIVTRLVNQARAAIVIDTAERAREAGFDRVRVFSTVDLTEVGEFLRVETPAVERTQARQLIGSLVARAAQSATGPVCYAGTGMAAMTVEDWSEVLGKLTSGIAITNRMFSCDWLGVPDGRLLECVRGERVDNRFALLVRDRQEVAVESFPRSGRSLMDVDTPADLVVLKLAMRAGSEEIGPATQAELSSQRELDELVRTARTIFDSVTRRNGEFFVSGRVSGSDWAALDRDTSCRVRVLSEERGLRTRGKPAKSILAELYEWTGPELFAERLSELGSAMIWDTRPFCSHLGWELTREDRFAADLGWWHMISHRGLQELMMSLQGSPVLTGGHSLVSGGMLVGIDAAWTRRESSG